MRADFSARARDQFVQALPIFAVSDDKFLCGHNSKGKVGIER